MIIRKAFALACAIISFTGLNAQEWITLENIIPDVSTVGWTSNLKGSSTNTSLVNALKNTQKDGKWHTYLSSGGSGSANVTYKDGTVDTSKMLSLSGRDSGSEAWVQHYTLFDLDENVRSAQAAKVSFNVDFLGTKDTVGNSLDINVLPWIVREQEIELRSASPGQQNLTKYLFGLVNLSTGEFIDCQLSNGDVMAFDYGSNNWFWTADDTGTLTASFYLDSSVLAQSSDGFALVIESTWGGGYSSGAEYYSIGDFKVEMLEQIPEPSTYALLFGFIAVCAIFLQRRKQ